MGYYTWFKLDTKTPDPTVSVVDIANWIKEKNNKDEAFFYPFIDSVDEILSNKEGYENDHSIELEPYDEAKWYDYDKEMKELSNAFPKVVFELHGDGEESGDSWIAWYKGGKSVRHEAEIPPLDDDEFD